MPVVSDYTALLSGSYWNGIEVTGKPVIVTYSFPTTAPAYLSNIPEFSQTTIDSFQAFTPAMQAQAEAELGRWAAASGIVFIKVAPGQGDLNFQLVDLNTTAFSGAGGIGFYPFGNWDFASNPYFTDSLDSSGDVFMNSQFVSGGLLNRGTLLHEIGHALGLKHPTEVVTNFASLPTPTLHDQVLVNDDPSLTIMAQTPGGPGTDVLQPLDLAAVSFLYGADGTEPDVVTGNAAGSNSVVSAWSWNAGTQTLTQTGFATGDVIRGTSVTDVINGQGGADRLFGLAGNDTLNGGAGNDTLYGGSGVNTLVGGADNDTYYLLNATDTITENNNDGFDSVFAGLSVTLAANVEYLQLFGFNLTATGNDSGNTIFGDAVYGTKLIGLGGNDTITGGDGDDTIIGGAGADSLIGGLGTDTLSYEGSTGGAVTVNLVTGVGAGGDAAGDTFSGFENVIGGNAGDTITGDTGPNLLIGGTGNDTINGGDGNDTIIGGAGADSLTGGNDIDTLSYAGSTVGVSVNLSNNTASLGDAQGDTITGFENVIGGDGNDTITGGAGANALTGGLGNDTFNVSGALDAVDNVDGGGGGTDTLVANYSAATGNLVVAAFPNNFGNFSGSITDSASSNGVNFSDIDSFTITTGSGNDDFNVYSGLSGSLTGGAGTDRLILQGYSDLTNLTTNGIETLVTLGSPVVATTGFFSGFTSIVYSDPINQPTVQVFLQLSGAGTADLSAKLGAQAANVTASALGNSITTGTGDDTLNGSQTNDTLIGGGGSDTIYGNDGNDSLSGGSGNDTIDGGVGNDIISGGDGDDTIFDFNNSVETEALSIDAGIGNDSISVYGAYTGSIAGGTGADKLFIVPGSADLSAVTVSGVETLVAGGSLTATATVLTGFTSIVYSDTTPQPTSAISLRLSGSGTADLSAKLGAQAAYVTASSLGNSITTGSGDDFLTGSEANDTLIGGNGANSIYGYGGNDSLAGGSGTDTIDGGEGNDNISGGGSNDTLTGGVGDDTISGGDGDDNISDFTNVFGVTELLSIDAGIGNDSITIYSTNIGSIDGGTGTDKLFTLSTVDLTGLAVTSIETLVTQGSDVTASSAFFNALSSIVYNDVTPQPTNYVYLRLSNAGTVDLSAKLGAQNANVTASNLGNSITTGSGDDFLTGSDANDTLIGGNGANTILGNGGNDSLVGGTGTDIIDGGTGNDNITGGGSNDTISGGDGNDIISGGDGDDTITDYNFNGSAQILSIDAGIGNDSISIYGTDSGSIAGGTGTDKLFIVGQTDLSAATVSGVETLVTQGQQVTATAGVLTGFTSIVYSDSTPQPTVQVALVLSGIGTADLSAKLGAQAAFVTTSSLGNSVTTGNGNDNLEGSNANDTLNSGIGNDTIVGNGGNDSLSGGNGNDNITGGDGNDIISGGDGDDTITDYNSDGSPEVLSIDAGIGNDTITIFGTDSGSITGGTGTDKLFLASTSDLSAVTVSGVETLSTQGHQVTATASVLTSFTSIVYSDPTPQPTVQVTLILSGTGTADLSAKLGAQAAFVTTSSLGNSVTTGNGNDYLAGSNANDTLNSGIGNDTIYGNGGNDSLSGGNGNDTIDGSDGNDNISGGDGDDTITDYNSDGSLEVLSIDAGIGNDTITVFGTDSGSIIGGTGTDKLFLLSTSDLSAVTVNTVETLVTQGHFLTASAAVLNSFTSIVYSDPTPQPTAPVTIQLSGTGTADLSAKLGAQAANVTTSSLGNSITTGSGNDNLTGGTANDTLNGGAGSDGISGGEGADTLTGGAGNDTLDGGTGNDVATFSGNRANYTITDNGDGSFTVVDNVGTDGTDRLTNIENGQFLNGSFSISGVSNSPPTITSNGGGASAAISIPENTSAVTTVTATDPDAGTSLTYSLSGADAARFTINATTGALAFISAPNFEAPTDGGANNVYDIVVTASDGTLTDTQALAVTVTNANEAPVITSNGGGATAALSVQTGTTAVTTVAATDPDAGTSLVYSLSGADAAKFSINATTGAIAFLTPPNVAAPTDAGANNVYDIVVTASDGTLTDTQALAVTVVNTVTAPLITSNGGGATAAISIPENTSAVTTVTATDPDAGTTLTYSLAGGADAAKFAINAATGVLTFIAAPNFEAPTDGGTNNVYDVIVQVSDGSLIDTQALAVTVTNVNEAPVITSAATASVVENSAGTVYTATATDPDAGTTLAYSLGGADATRFTINAATGAVSFIAAPNFEGPTDAGTNNVYDITVFASDGTTSTSQAVAITVTNANEAPVITSNGGGASAAISIPENTSAVTTVTATDPDAGTSLTYSLSGADAARFTINATTGALAFISAPNFEAPTDGGANNVYDIVVTASDGTLTDTQALAVTVTNANEAPVITSNGGGATAALSVQTGTTAVTTVAATDPDAGTSLVYSLSGADAAKFSINATTGAIAFLTAPNVAAPTDAGANNVYDIVVTASDGTLTDTQALAVTVVNTVTAPTITSNGGGASAAISIPENTSAVTTVTATDPDAGTTLTYSLAGGADAAKFAINAATGVLTFIAAPNFEAPTDGGTNNVYDVIVQVSDGSLIDTQALAVTVTNVNEAPVITSAATASVVENSAGTVYTATATDPDAGTTLAYSLGGADATRFTINAATGAVSFIAAPNFEGPTDAGTNNVYDITVFASDGTTSTSQAVAITVTNANEAPVITSNGGGASAAISIPENTSAVTTVTATDPDAGTSLTYSLSGADAARFTINATTGALAFISAPNFEAPTDGGANNVYDIVVTASDGTLTDTQALAVTVTNANEAPVITSNGGGATAALSVQTGTTAVTTVAATDPDAGTSLVYSLSGADAAKFSINATTGAIAFLTPPNVAAPTDAGANNVYDIVVTASDGTLTDTQALAVTVVNTVTAPLITSNGGGATAAISIPENTSAVTTVTATDPDAGTTLTYSLAGGADAAKFAINAATGVLTFIAAPNFEAPTDGGTNNVYDVIVQVSDGSLIDTQALAVTVTNVNEAPVITSAATASVVENSAGTVYTATATDPDAGTTLAYSLGGADATRFTINAATGAVSFIAAPNFEGPTDAGTNNVYDITVFASDGTTSTSQAVAITVTNANEAPVITSNGGGASAAISIPENTSAVTTVTATDPDAGTSLTYSLSGADAARFTINATTGALAFISAPNFEAPTDGGANNVYDIVVTASDGTLTDTQALAVTVTNANEAPVITSNGGGATAALSVQTGTTAVTTVAATDPDAGTSLVYSLSGADAAKFSINATTGAIAFLTPPNVAAPTDAGANNVYDIVVTASDGTLTDTQALAVTVVNTVTAPLITSNGGGATAAISIPENTSAVTTVTATDPDAGTTLTYSLAGGADAAKFAINAATGVLTFIAAPNFEAPTDGGTNNVYDVIVQVSDGSLIDTQALAVTVTNVNEAPVITSAATASVVENSAGTVYTATATDPDAGTTLAYSLGGADATRFTINAATGAVSFIAAPNFEGPTDAGTNNVYDITVFASDGTTSTSQAVAITVTNANEAPVITSNGGGASAAISVAENTTAVTTVTATDPDAGTSLVYSLSGADAARFTINATTGALAFISAPNFEAPTDGGANNVYDIVVTASDGTLTDTQALAVTVTNANEAPVITSNGGGATAALSVQTGTTAVTTVAATDPDAGTSLVYSLSGADAAKFSINATTGAIAFLTAPNVAAPTDAGANNVYDIVVTASDGTLTDTQALAVTVVNTVTAPTITSNGGGASAAISIPENTSAVTTVTATDPDAGTTLTYSLAGGADAAKFAINAATGVLTFIAAPNFEAPTDGGTNNVYDVIVQVSDGSLIDTQALAVTVTNVNEAPVITSAATASVVENSAGTVYTATATDPDAGTTLAYSLGGADATRFTINAATGAVSFIAAPNFEGPTDAGTNNVYDITVFASDGTTSTSQAVAITVTNANEAPVITSNGGGASAAISIPENTSAVTTVTATDPDAGTSLTYSLSGADAARFTINATTGALAFISAPNFEAPTDGGANNVYDIVVTASDGTLTDTQALAVTVTNANEAPVITSNGGGATAALSVQTGTTAVTTVAATDPDAGTSLVYSLSGADAAKFSINATTGAIAFLTAPNVAAPTDAGANNVYDIVVTASDGTLTDTQALAVTVVNTVTAPTITSNGGGATAAISIPENTSAVTTVTATDPDAGTTLTYSLAGGADAAKFAINAATGVLTFIAPPNFEAPTDGGANNVYDVIVQVSDGSLIDTQALAVTITNVNEAPVITSAATASVVENSAGTVYTATATDPDAGTTLAYSLGGADAARFTINAATGAVSFIAAPNFEGPTDAGTNNVYDITVFASDGTTSTSQAVAITVTNANEAPVITSNGGGASAAISIPENTSAVTTVTATDPDAGTSLVYSLSGADAAKFSINATTGAIAFLTPPNVLAPTDAGGDNVYDIVVTASDGTLTDTQALAVTVIAGGGPQIVTLTSGPDTFQQTSATTAFVVNGLAGADVIATGLGSDTITGGVGNDVLSANGGNDVFLVGSNAGRDAFDGGAGTDTILATAANIQIGIAALSGIEAISANGFANVSIIGSNADNLLDFSATQLTGIGLIDGAGGNDTIIGSAGDDTIAGGFGQDLIQAGGGNDVIQFSGNSNDDRYDGGGGSDRLVATGDNASLRWNNVTSVETIDGNGFAGVRIVGTGLGDTLDLSAATLNNIAAIDAGAGNDIVLGSGGNDVIIGGFGRDTLNGNGGDDRIIGGAKADILTGGEGSDTFVFAAGFGSDTITDFNALFDTLEFSGGLFANDQAAFDAATDVGANLVVTLDASNTVTLLNVQKSALTIADFHVV